MRGGGDWLGLLGAFIVVVGALYFTIAGVRFLIKKLQSRFNQHH